MKHTRLQLTENAATTGCLELVGTTAGLGTPLLSGKVRKNHDAVNAPMKVPVLSPCAMARSCQVGGSQGTPGSLAS